MTKYASSIVKKKHHTLFKTARLSDRVKNVM